MKVRARLNLDEATKLWVATVPELGSISAYGATENEAVQQLKAAIWLWFKESFEATSGHVVEIGEITLHKDGTNEIL